MAFEEVKRQVGIQCKERATILDALWSHALTLVELRYVWSVACGLFKWLGLERLGWLCRNFGLA